MIRRLDHLAVAVSNTETALTYFRDALGLKVVTVDEPPGLGLKLTYLDIGNTYLQLVEPLEVEHPLAKWLAEHGDGLHHICFGVDNVTEELRRIGPADAHLPPVGSGRGRPAGFPAGDPRHGVRVECTLFDRDLDVEASSGMLGR